MRYAALLLCGWMALSAASAGSAASGACSLISSDAIQKAFGEDVAHAKPDAHVTGKIAVAQCFYSLPTFTNSVSVSVTRASGKDRDAARELWKRSFHGETDEKDGDRSGESEEREAMGTAAPLKGIGDEAFWVHSFVGNLYVLKGNSFLRISIGGKFSDEERQAKALALARETLKNLGR